MTDAEKQELIAYYREDAEARVEEVLPLPARIAMTVERVEILERRLAMIEVAMGLQLGDLLSNADIQTMASQEATLSWVRGIRATARAVIGRVQAGERVAPDSVEWPVVG